MSAFSVKSQIIEVCRDRHIDAPSRLNKMSEKEAQKYLDRLVNANADDKPSTGADQDDFDHVSTPELNLPHQVTDSMSSLCKAILCYSKRRLYLAAGHKYTDDQAKAYVAEAEKALLDATGICLNPDGSGHERGLKIMNILTLALFDTQSRFTDYMISNAVLNSVLYDKSVPGSSTK